MPGYPSRRAGLAKRGGGALREAWELGAGRFELPHGCEPTLPSNEGSMLG